MELLAYSLPRVRTGDGPMIKKVHYFPPAHTKTSIAGAITVPWKPSPDDPGPIETGRRDRVIKESIRKLPFAVGALVRPADDQVYAEQGVYRITGFIMDYNMWLGNKAQTHKDWPTNNMPMIINAQNLRNHNYVVATVGYFTTEGM